ncbi:MAG: hypothetical protein HY901_34355 [Deltaproteobacteria bacterium]|nr:hypothetical protein [Deltaproteobacteria bacterium]
MRFKSTPALLLLAPFLACAAEDRGATERPQVFAERQFLKADKPTKDLFGDCSQGGESDCRTGLCLNTEAGYVCSKECTEDEACGSGRCATIHPGLGGRFCLPAE